MNHMTKSDRIGFYASIALALIVVAAVAVNGVAW